MANTNINKVIYGGNVLIDLTADTITAADLASGKTAHDKSGAIITGTNTYDSDTSADTATAAEVLATKTAHVRGAQVTGTMPNRGAVTGTISTKTQQYTIPNGYHDGSGKVSISSTEQAKIIAENIRQGVTILGVEGTMSGTEDVTAEAVTADAYTDTNNVITPSTGYNYLSQVTINQIYYAESDNPAGGKTVTIGKTSTQS